MKLGFITAICDGMTFEEVVDFASENHLECLEVACWPQGGAQRRYAGVSHIDAANMNEDKAAYIKKYCKDRNVEISSLAYYPNTLEPDIEKRQSYIGYAGCEYDYYVCRARPKENGDGESGDCKGSMAANRKVCRGKRCEDRD